MAFVRELSCWELVVDGSRFVRDNSRDYVRAAAFPVLGIAGCEGIAWELGEGWTSIPFDLVSYAFLAILAVKWHRFYLLGRGVAAPGWALTFGSREIRFFLYLAACSLVVTGLISAFGMWIVGLDMVLLVCLLVGGLAVWTFVCCRLALVLPAAAVGMPGGFFDALAGSWRCMRGATFGLFSALFILGLAATLTTVFILVIGGLLPLPTLILALIFILIGIVVEGIGITVLSIAFDRRTSWRDDGPAPEGV